MNAGLKLAPLVATLGFGISTNSLAADIDIYTKGSSSSSSNVLFYLDNSSNWSNSAQAWTKDGVTKKCGSNADCLKYVNLIFGNESSLVQGQVEVRALKVVLQELACNTGAPYAVNVGLMMNSDSGTADKDNQNSGYIRRRILPLSAGAESCTTLITDLTDIDKEITSPSYKTSSSIDYGSPLFEAFKYFGGYANSNGEAGAMGNPASARGFGPTRYSNAVTGEDAGAFVDGSNSQIYKSPIDEDYCGKNYIVVIGNTWPNQEYKPDTNATPPTNSVMKYLGLTPAQRTPFTSSTKSLIRFADEWTAFLARTDVSEVSGHQPVKTFTVDVYNTKPDTNQTALLLEMAKAGGTGVGGAYSVDGDLAKLVEAFKTILGEIAAVNSAFASASLPISVNTQGTYLNQVFIGMFRPDPNSRPRWAGNLKQYQFKILTSTDGKTTTRNLYLADADGKAAIDNANTGFLKGCTRSFWTTNSDNYWASVTAVTDSGIPDGSCPNPDNSNAIYNDKPDGSIVERGGAAEYLRLAAPGDRLIQTCANSKCTGSTPFSATTTDRLWIQGKNVGDGYNSATQTSYSTYGKSTDVTRPTVHGGVIHSRPLAINYGSGTEDKVVVFYGADDGILRAVNGSKSEVATANGGKELWAFLPNEFESRLTRNRDNYPYVTFFDDPTAPKDFFFDGSLGAYVGPVTISSTVSNKKFLYATMRRGGHMVYAFDITADPTSTVPTPMWRFGCTDTAKTNCVGSTGVTKIGQTWSTPRIIRVKDQSTLYAVFGAGYDSCEDTEPRNCSTDSTGHGIFVLDAVSGDLLKFIDFGSTAGHVAADLVAIDTNNDGYSDVIYAADTLGNLWRVNLTDPKTSGTQNQNNWIVTQVAKVGDWSSTNERNRKFLYAPDVVTVAAYNIVLIGTGNREKPLDTSKAALVKNRFYGFWDEYARTSGSDTPFTLIDDSNDCDAAGDTVLKSGCQVMNTSDVTQNYNTAFATASRPRGWLIDLDSTSVGAPYEQVVTTAATIGGYVNFSTFQAKNEQKCSSLGTARGYAACFIHGGASCDGPLATGTSRSEKFVGGGLPPSPVAGTVEVDGKIVPFIIGGKPEAPGGSALEAKLPPIPIKKDRMKVYRYKQID